MKKAVILFNLGGPDSLSAVRPFLFNLFYDRCIINLPNPFRWLLAKYISYKRAPFAREIYKHLGGSSTILKETVAQQNSLQKILGEGYRVFIAMRYWRPFIEEILPNLSAEEFEEVILLPLYPQFSIATSFSSIASCYSKIQLPKKVICCYYDHPLFIEAHANLIEIYYRKAAEITKPIILFSAHGLPESFIRRGDPYQFQIEKSVEFITKRLGIKNLDFEICYQSKVGRRRWLEPSTESSLKKYKNRSIVLVPIAFVSEHSETLVELDIEYAKLAKDIFRVPTLSSHAKFIKCLADLCKTEEFRRTPCPEKCKQCFQLNA